MRVDMKRVLVFLSVIIIALGLCSCKSGYSSKISDVKKALEETCNAKKAESEQYDKMVDTQYKIEDMAEEGNVRAAFLRFGKEGGIAAAADAVPVAVGQEKGMAGKREYRIFRQSIPKDAVAVAPDDHAGDHPRKAPEFLRIPLEIPEEKDPVRAIRLLQRTLKVRKIPVNIRADEYPFHELPP